MQRDVSHTAMSAAPTLILLPGSAPSLHAPSGSPKYDHEQTVLGVGLIRRHNYRCAARGVMSDFFSGRGTVPRRLASPNSQLERARGRLREVSGGAAADRACRRFCLKPIGSNGSPRCGFEPADWAAVSHRIVMIAACGGT